MVTNRGRQGAVYRRTQDGRVVMVAMAIGSAPSRCRGFGMLVALDILAWSPNVMTGELARHTIRILQFQVLYGNIPGVQIPIPQPPHTRRPKLHSRTKFQATEKQQEQQQPLEAKHRAIYCYYVLVACKLKERRARAASQQSMNSDMFPNAIHRRDTSTLRQTHDKDTCTCRSRRNTIQIATHGHDRCIATHSCRV